MRLTEAKAKIELREEATQQDALDIIEIMKDRLNLLSLLVVCVNVPFLQALVVIFSKYQLVVKLCSCLLLCELLWLCWFLSYVQTVPTWQARLKKI